MVGGVKYSLHVRAPASVQRMFGPPHRTAKGYFLSDFSETGASPDSRSAA